MDASEKYDSLSEEEKNFLNVIAQNVAILVSSSDEHVSASKRLKHFRVKLCEFAEKWDKYNIAYEAYSIGEWLPSMGQPINPLGAIWPAAYSLKWEDSICPELSTNKHSISKYFVPKDIRLLGDYALLGVIHDEILPHCSLITKGYLSDELKGKIWYDLVTGVDLEGKMIMPGQIQSPAAVIRKDKIKGSLDDIKADIEMLSKRVAAAWMSETANTGITPPKTRDSVTANQKQKLPEAERSKPREKSRQDNSKNESYIKKGIKWEFVYLGEKAFVYSKLKGLVLIEYLILNKNQEYTPLELLKAVRQREDTETESEKTYSPKDIDKINEAIEELKNRAELSTDPQEKDRFEQDVEKAEIELHKARNFMGKSRNISDRHRMSVIRNIDRVLNKISPQHPELYNHLDTFLKRGEICSYKPDSKIIWNIF